MHEFFGVKWDFCGVKMLIFTPAEDENDELTRVDIETFVGDGGTNEVSADGFDDFS